MRRMVHVRHLSARLIGLFIVSTFGMLLLGVWVDRTMGTAPLGMLALAIPGILLGTVATYRMVQAVNEQLAPSVACETTQSRDELRGGE